MKLLTAKKGEPHFTSNHFRAMLESVFGNGSYVSEIYEGLAPELSANNIVKIHSGILIHHGGLFLIEPGTYDEVNYMNGTQSMKRIDLIVARYTKNRDTGYEDCEWVIVQGEPAQVDPVAPSYESGNMQNGDFVDDCPVFEIHFDGITVTEIKPLLETVQNIDELTTELRELNSKVAFSKMSMGKATLDYYDPNWLACGVVLDKSYSANAKIYVSIEYVPGSAVGNESYPTVSACLSGNRMDIWASGKFYSGHKLKVSYLVIE
jgi:hypothetical protein